MVLDPAGGRAQGTRTAARVGATTAGTGAWVRGSDRRRIHLSISTTTDGTAASPAQAVHCRIVSSWVSGPRCRKPSSVDRIRSSSGMVDHFTADRIGGVRPEVGSRRMTIALKIRPSPTHRYTILIDA